MVMLGFAARRSRFLLRPVGARGGGGCWVPGSKTGRIPYRISLRGALGAGYRAGRHPKPQDGSVLREKEREIALTNPMLLLLALFSEALTRV